MFDPRRLIDSIRDHPEGLARVRLGRGVVGNTTYGFITACAASVGLVWALNAHPWFAVGSCVAVWGGFLWYLRGTYKFADEHPDLAMLGDSEWLRYAEAQLAAKGVSELPPAPIIEAPRNGE